MEQSPEKFSLPSEDVEAITKEFETQKNLPEHAEHEPKEVIKKSLQNISTDNQPSPTPQEQSDSSLPSYLEGKSEAVKDEVSSLLNLAQTKGIKKASAQASKKSPFILDAFHDALAEKILKEEIVK